MLNKLKPYNKFLIALLGAVTNVIVQFYGNNTYITIVIALLTAVGVYQVPNKISEQ